MAEQDERPRLSELSDEELVAQCQSGDRESFSELVLRYQDRVVHIVAQRVGNRETAFDIAQDVFVKAYKGLKGFKSEAGFYTWLYRIAINTTLSHRRKVMRRGTMVSLDQPLGSADDSGASLGQRVASEGPEPQQEITRRETINNLRQAIAQLPEEFNEVIVLRDLQGLSYDEVAEVLQCPVGSVKSRLHRARKKLAEILQRRPTA